MNLNTNTLSARAVRKKRSGGGAPAIPVMTVAPSISGTLTEGSVLTGSNGTWTGAPTSYARQWKRNGVAIPGETNANYTAVAADTLLDVVLTFGIIATNVAGSSAEVISAGVEVVANHLAIAAKYWSVDLAYQDVPMTIPAVNDGDPVLMIKEQVTNAHHLNYLTSAVAGQQIDHIDDDNYGDSKPTPLIFTDDPLGGNANKCILIRNATPKRFETQGGAMGLALPYTAMYRIRLGGGTDNEYINFATGAPSFRDRDEATGNTFQLGALTSMVSVSGTGRFLADTVYKDVDYIIYIDAGGNAQLKINGVDFRVPVNVGTGLINEFVLGSNSHNAMGGYKDACLVAGVYDADKVGKVRKLWKKKFGDVNSYPVSYPTIRFESAGVYNDKETWNTVDKSINAPPYVFYSPIGAAEGATEFRLYTSQSATQATAIAQRTFVKKKVRGIDANPTKFIRGVDYVQDGFYHWIEARAVDVFNNRQKIETPTHGMPDTGV